MPELTPTGYTPLTEYQQRQLMAPLSAANVKNRSQGGAKVSYLEAWYIRARLTQIFGFGGFSEETLTSELIHQARVPKRNSNDEQWEIVYHCTVRLTIPQLGCVFTESAVAGQKGPEFGEVADFAAKTAASDAFKRCAMNLGTQFGLSLYNRGALSDVVKAIVAPGQEWFKGERFHPQPAEPDEAKTARVNQVEEALTVNDDTGPRVAPAEPEEDTDEPA